MFIPLFVVLAVSVDAKIGYINYELYSTTGYLFASVDTCYNVKYIDSSYSGYVKLKSDGQFCAYPYDSTCNDDAANLQRTCSSASILYDEPSKKYKIESYTGSQCTNSNNIGFIFDTTDSNFLDLLNKCLIDEDLNGVYNKITCGKGYKQESGNCVKDTLNTPNNNGGYMKGIVLFLILLVTLI